MNLRGTAVLSAVVLVAGMLGTTVADARGGRGHGPARSYGHSHSHGHGHGGGARVFFYAAPVFVGAYAASRYYYPPPVYVAPAPPAVYIEQPVPDPAAQAYWYYCPQSNAYYPQVQSCAGGWQRVAPQPPPR
jgi:hypothetical protein